MTWSYSGDPASSPKDGVRFFVQDTIAADPQISDEEIAFLLSDENDAVIRAAARSAEAIAAKYARQVDKSVGGLSLSAGRRQEKYEKLASRLWSRSGTTGVGAPLPYSGGLTVAGNPADLTTPIFSRHMQEFESDTDAGT